jgi:hypothetical protein
MNKYTSSPHIDIEEPEIQGYPLMADLDISKEKVKGTATMGFSSGIGAPIEECKRSAIGNALIASDADVLIEPFYIIETTESSVSVMVSGFPAKYKNFRKDVEKMQAINATSVNQTTIIGPMQRPAVSNVQKTNPATPDQNRNSSVGGTVFGALALIVGLPLLIMSIAGVFSE